MTEKELIEAIGEGLQLDWKAQPGSGASWLVKYSHGLTQTIHFTTTKRPNGFHLAGTVNAFKSFAAVEDIFNHYMTTYKIEYDPRLSTIFTQSYDSAISFIEIDSSDRLKKIIMEIRRMVEKDLLPFFEKYHTLDHVHEKIKTLNENLLGTFVCDPASIRTMIIKKLINANDFDQYAEETLRIFRQHSTGPHASLFAPYYQFLPALYEDLKNREVNCKINWK